MNRVLAFLDRVLTAVGILPAESAWRWTGKPGWPRYALEYEADGFVFRAELTPSLLRPAILGRFCDKPEASSFMLDDGRLYVPHMNVRRRIAELMASGMTHDAANRQVLRELNNEAELTSGYERGYWSSFTAKLTVLRGRERLATRTIDGINLDPVMLLVGREQHVTDMLRELQPALIEAARHEASRSAATGMSLRRW